MTTLEVQVPQYAAETLWTPARYKGLYGGRGGAKTRSVATALITQAMAEHHRILCGREVQASIRDSSKRVLDDEIARLGVGDVFTSTETEIRGPNESLFLFSGLRGSATTIKSMEGLTRFWGDEAQRFSQSSLDTVIPTVRALGSELWFTWNPDLPTDPIDRLLRTDACPPDAIVREVNWYDNPWFPDVLRREMEWDRGRDTDKYLHIWEGKYRANSEARVFRNWRVEEFEAPADAVHRFGADFGFAIDPTVLVRCHIIGRTIYVDYEAYMIGCEIVNTPALFLTVPEAEKWPIVADSARPETISHLRQHGFPRIMPAVKGKDSVHEGIEWLKSYDIVVHPRCRHTIDELGSYSYKTDPLTGAVLPKLADDNNHVIDAVRYACEGVRRAPEKKQVPVKVIPVQNAWRR